MTFHLMFVMSGHILGKLNCPLGWPCVFTVLCLFVILVLGAVFGF